MLLIFFYFGSGIRVADVLFCFRREIRVAHHFFVLRGGSVLFVVFLF